MEREHFLKVVEETLDSLSREFRTRIRDVAVLVEDMPPHQPSPHLGQHWRLLLLLKLPRAVACRAFAADTSECTQGIKLEVSCDLCDAPLDLAKRVTFLIEPQGSVCTMKILSSRFDAVPEFRR